MRLHIQQPYCPLMDTDALTLTLWPPPSSSRPTAHFNHLTCLAYDPSSSSLYTAARDARVIQWQQPDAASPSSPWLPAAAAAPHTDWINDIQCLGGGAVLSCSSDCNVTITSILTSAVVRQFRYHDDHVTCLSPVSSTGTFVSAGLDGYCCLWDAEVGGGGTAASTAQPGRRQ